MSKDSAFPYNQSPTMAPVPGMNKREYFTATALQGLAAKDPTKTDKDIKDLAARAVAVADAVVSELNKKVGVA